METSQRMAENQDRMIVEDEDTQPVFDLDEHSEVIPYTFEITAYGADFPVDGLVKRLETGDITIPLFGTEPDAEGVSGFQREYVWNKVQADRFIESLLLGLPVPGIFLVRELSGVMLVLDGHQRLKTLQAFYKGVLGGKEFKLSYVQPRLQGLTYSTLDPEDRRRLDNSIIHATILRQDQPSEDQSSIYLIFERLNSGGTILQPQEIRVALYHGQLSILMASLNTHPSWRSLYGKRSARLKDIELILRFFALLQYGDQYRRPLKGFLNTYMAANRNLQLQSRDELDEIFKATTDAILHGIGPMAFKPRRALNAAVLDSLMVGTARRIQAAGRIADPNAMRVAYDALLENPVYLAAIETATANEDLVRARLDLATEAFADVP